MDTYNYEPEDYNGYIPRSTPQNFKRSYTDQIDFIQELLLKNELKDKISEPLQLHLASFLKTAAIANFTEADIKTMILRFDSLKLGYLMQFPPGAYSWQLEYEFSILRDVFYMELTRGRDGFERKLMATSINQTYMQSDFRNSQPQSGGGLTGRIKKFFGRY